MIIKLANLWALNRTTVTSGGVRASEQLLRCLAICLDHSLPSLPTYLVAPIFHIIPKVCLRELKSHKPPCLLMLFKLQR